MHNAFHLAQESKPSLKCFASSTGVDVYPSYSTRVRHLANAVSATPIKGSSGRLESFGRVIPLLICGEQSAISVFGSARGQYTKPALKILSQEFRTIETEEAGHELLWQPLSHHLPVPPDLLKLKRRAAIFFAKLGRANSIAEHFAQVSQLDSAVGAIMWSLERSGMATDSTVREIATHIKLDEARHVSVSRRLTFALGVERDRYEALGDLIRQELIELLTPIADSIEGLGIDSDRMFRKIAKH